MRLGSVPSGAKEAAVCLLQQPLDIILEIVKHLEWSDILCLRQSYHTLNSICDERHVWLSLLLRYQATLEPRRHWPDRPLRFYDDTELQRIVLQPFRVDRAWRTDNLAPSFQRTVSVDRAFSSEAYELIRGGRWLLIGTSDGSVLYVDLESRNVSSRVLIPPIFGAPDREVRVRMSINMDDEAPYLTFNIVVSMYYGASLFNAPPMSANLRPLQIWKITAIPDSLGHAEYLKAEILSSYYESARGGAKALALHGNFLAFSIPGGLTFIVDWTKREANPRVQRVLRSSYDHIIFLPNGWIAVCGGGTFDIYHLDDIPETSARWPEVKTDIKPAKSFKLSPIKISKPFLVRDSLRFVCAWDHGFQVSGLVFPLSDPCNLTLVPLYRRKSIKYKLNLGYSDAIVGCTGSDISVLHYSWADAGAQISFSPKNVRAEGFCTLADKLSGRMIIIHRKNGTAFDIVEFL